MKYKEEDVAYIRNRLISLRVKTGIEFIRLADDVEKPSIPYYGQYINPPEFSDVFRLPAGKQSINQTIKDLWTIEIGRYDRRKGERRIVTYRGDFWEYNYNESIKAHMFSAVMSITIINPEGGLRGHAV